MTDTETSVQRPDSFTPSGARVTWSQTDPPLPTLHCRICDKPIVKGERCAEGDPYRHHGCPAPADDVPPWPCGCQANIHGSHGVDCKHPLPAATSQELIPYYQDALGQAEEMIQAAVSYFGAERDKRLSPTHQGHVSMLRNAMWIVGQVRQGKS